MVLYLQQLALPSLVLRASPQADPSPPPPASPSPPPFDPRRMIGIIERKGLIKELAAVYHAECLAYSQELLELQRKWEEGHLDPLYHFRLQIGISHWLWTSYDNPGPLFEH